MKKMDADYWNEYYVSKHTPWDLNQISTPIKEYIDQLENKSLKILIPGAGNAHEAEYLFKNGFKNVFIVDFAQQTLDNFGARNPDFPKEQFICNDFFKIEGQYDLILEQTFFCAIDPKLRSDYAKKMNELLIPGGKLVGVLFNRTFEDGPPFGGEVQEYLTYFTPYFSEIKLQACYNSIAPRVNSELFMQLIK